MITTVLFDVDGVLLNAHQANFKLYQILFTQFGIKPPIAKIFPTLIHNTLRHNIIHIGGVKDEAKIQAILNAAATIPYPEELVTITTGAQQSVKDLSGQYTLGIVTGRIKAGIDRLFNTFGHKELFKVAIYAELYTNPKPHPEPIELALKALNVKPHNAVYIGDGATDMLSARAAGTKAIYFGKQDQSIDADAYTTSFSRLPLLIKKL